MKSACISCHLVVAFICISLCWSQNFTRSTVDFTRTIFYGPGFTGNVTLPVRYFLFQLVDTEGRNLTVSPGVNIVSRISAHLSDQTSQHNLLSSNFIQVLDLQTGILAVRFRLFHSLPHTKVLLHVLVDQEAPIGQSPFLLKGPLYSEGCHCPRGPLRHWLDSLPDCPTQLEQVERDFMPFSSHGIDMAVLGRAFEERHVDPHAMAACHYRVVQNRIFRKCYGEHIGFRMFSDSLLLSLRRKAWLPDLDFIMNLGDWPLISRRRRRVEELPIPVLSWCGSDDTLDIVLPTYELMESVLEMMNRQSLDVFHMLASAKLPWSSREKKAFWRGRDSSEERLNLVRLSLRHPEELDARLTNMFFFPNDSTLGERSPHVPFRQFFQYAYLPNLDGTVAAYRLPLLLAGGSLVMRQASPYYEHFYSALKSGQEYLPLRREVVQDLLHQVRWARENDKEAKRIADNGRRFVVENLLPHHVFCYHGRVLQKYAKLMRSSVHLPKESPDDGGFEEVIKTDFLVEEHDCPCERRFGGGNRKEEL